MKNVMLIISMLLLCIGVGAQTAKNVGKAGAVVKTVKAEERPEVLIETTMGNIRVALYNETPLHRDNFLKLIREYHYYDSLLFHRVIPDFMIQAGDPYSKNAPKGAVLGDHSLDYTIPAEIRLPQIYHKRGALAAAREPDMVNPKRESSSSQFYIVYGRKQDERGHPRGQPRDSRILCAQRRSAGSRNIQEGLLRHHRRPDHNRSRRKHGPFRQGRRDGRLLFQAISSRGQRLAS